MGRDEKPYKKRMMTLSEAEQGKNSVKIRDIIRKDEKRSQRKNEKWHMHREGKKR